MTPEQASLIEQAERLDKDATPGPWCHNRYGVNNWPDNEQPARLMELLHNQDDDEAQNRRDAEFIAHARTLVPALAAELKRALDENAHIKSRTGAVLDIIASRLELNPPISDDEQIDIEAVARWVKAIGAEHINALVTERDALRDRLAKCEPVIELVRKAKELNREATERGIKELTAAEYGTLNEILSAELPEMTK